MKDYKKNVYSVKENKKRQRKIINFILILFIFLTAIIAGCSKKTGNGLTELKPQQEAQKSSKEESAEKSKADYKKKKENAGSKADSQNEPKGKSEEEGAIAKVYVCGAVNAPGVYGLSSGGRVYEAIAMAGGLTPEAAGEALNQASLVKDGEKIYVPSKADLEKGITGEDVGQDAASKDSQGNKVNINTATREELKSLPGIGDAKADSIISHRETSGSFSSIEDLMRVEGIKEGLYNKVKDRITI